MGVSQVAKQAVKAWVNFDGTGTTGTNMTIRASYNVASVFKNGTGDYTINFTTPLTDANYSAIGTSGGGSLGSVGNDGRAICVAGTTDSTAPLLKTTTQLRVIRMGFGNGLIDGTENNVSVFR